VVDIDKVRGQLPSGANGTSFDPLSLLGGAVPVELRARLRAEEPGFARLEVEEISLASWPMPVSLLGQIVAAATRRPGDPDGFDVQAPFRLPRPVRRVRVEPGQAWLDF
jgi:hypothetical protein